MILLVLCFELMHIRGADGPNFCLVMMNDDVPLSETWPPMLSADERCREKLPKSAQVPLRTGQAC